MRLAVVLLLAPFLAAAVIGTAQAEILITVDKSAQRMTVARDGEALYTWPVSTGRSGYATPSGSFTPFRMEADHYSKEWDDAPMPHSIFFTKIGHAIHGSYHMIPRSSARPRATAAYGSRPRTLLLCSQW